MKFYNLMSAAGFEGGMGIAFFMAWIGLALLVIVGMIAKKWLGEEEIMPMPYNWIGSLLGVIAYVIVCTITGSAKISLVAGLIGMIGGGYGLGATIGGTEE